MFMKYLNISRDILIDLQDDQKVVEHMKIICLIKYIHDSNFRA